MRNFTCSILCKANNKSTIIFHGLFPYRSWKWRQNVQTSSGTTSRSELQSFELLMSFLWSIFVPTTKNCRLFFFFFSKTDGHFWWCFLRNYIYLFTIIIFLTKRYTDGGRHLKSNVQDGGDSIIVRTAKYACFTVYNRRQNCWDIIHKLDNLEEQNNPHSSPIPSVEGWGVSCFQQVAGTAAQRCMEGVGEGKIYFPF